MTDFLVVDFIKLVLIFMRIISAFMASPIWGNRSIPTLAKVSFAIFVSYVLLYTVDRPEGLLPIDLYYISLLAIREIVTGLVIGFSINLVFYGVNFAGTFIGFDMGLMMAQTMNPLEETQSNALGQFVYYAAVLVFFIINGHHFLFKGLTLSYQLIPIGGYTVKNEVYELLVIYSAGIFGIAVKIAAPFLVSYLLIHIGEGIISRVIPQMQVFFVTQPLKLGIGFLMLAMLIPIYIYVIKNLLVAFEEDLYQLIKAMA